MKTKKKNKSRRFKAVMLFVVIGLLVSVKLYNDVRANELTRAIEDEKSAIETLKSDATKLNVSIDKKTNLSNVELKAVNELGLVKIEKYQIEYISLPGENKIETVKNEDDNSFLTAVARGFSVVLEFLS